MHELYSEVQYSIRWLNNNEFWIGKDVEESSSGLFPNAIPASGWQQQANHSQQLVSKNKIHSLDLLNINQMC